MYEIALIPEGNVRTMRIAITGAKGQLGHALQAVLINDDLLLLDLPEYDITNLDAIVSTLTDFGPEVIIHGAAITNVDGCEADRDLAFRVNVVGTRNIAVAAQQVAASLVYISTDYVFPGRDEPYGEYDACQPLSYYGLTKWYGEQIVRDLCSRFYIARTAWLYGDSPRNFCETVLRLAAERDHISMVTDEVGSPTHAMDLAAALDRLIRMPAYGIYQFSSEGTCSRYEWAQEILKLAGVEGYDLRPSSNYQRAARVPTHVDMLNQMGAAVGIEMPDWRQALVNYFAWRAAR